MSEGDTDTALQSTATLTGGAEIEAPQGDAGRPTRPGKAKPIKPAASIATQAEPTAPRPRDPETGLELDEYGLPTSGPARRQWLAEAGIDDPALKSAAEKETQND